MSSSLPGFKRDVNKRLAVKEDVLCYLGVLVDILQEWDRNTIERSSVVSGQLPVQGVDVNLSRKKGRVVVHYRDTDRAKAVRRNLTKALVGWAAFVEVK
jgi:hypothetical protein